MLAIRKELKDVSALGEYGAEAIHREMTQRRCEQIPTARTINRILERRGQFDGRRRVRRPVDTVARVTDPDGVSEPRPGKKTPRDARGQYGPIRLGGRLHSADDAFSAMDQSVVNE